MKPNPCCNVDSNLALEEQPRESIGYSQGKAIKLIASVRKCSVCGARHHLSEAEAIPIGVKGGGT